MTLPTTYLAALLLCILSMICWGSWANTTKLTGKWRFELFYFDYAFGVLLAATIIAFTFGTFGSDITFMDNLTIVRRKQQAYALAAGVVFNLANMLLVGAITVAGMAVAFPIAIGLALVIGVVWSYALKPQGNPTLLFGGIAVVTLAILVTAAAYRHLRRARAEADAAEGKKKVSAGPLKGILLSVISGLLMGSFYPMVEMARQSEIEMGPYPIGFVFAIGVFASTLLFNVYFLNLPIEGKPISPFHYFKGTLRQHSLGILGGIIWCVGTIANFVAASAPAEANVGPAISYALGQGATLISTLWGLLYWNEFAGASDKARTLIWTAVGLYLIGLALVSAAPLLTL